MPYPDIIFEQRSLENLPGLMYDRENKKTLFAEDLLQHGTEITAIETTLGTGVTGDYSTVADRLDHMSGGGGGGSARCAIYTHSANMITSGGFEQITGIETAEFDDTGGLFYAPLAALTADKIGRWRLGVYLEVNVGPRWIYTIFKNGVEYHRMIDTLGSSGEPASATTLCSVEEGDVLQFYLYCSANGMYRTEGRLEIEEII